MEIKKSKAADLERKRPWMFLFGLVVSVVGLLLVLEIKYGGDEQPIKEQSYEELMADIEMAPIKKEEEELVAMEAPRESPPVADKIKAVDMDVELTLPEEAQSEGKGENEITEEEGGEGDTLKGMNTEISNPLHFRVVEDIPQFPGGANEFIKWLTKNLRYPSQAQKQKIEGKVMVQFIVEIDGSISNLEVVKSVAPALDMEAMRVMKKMPQWKPGMQNNEPCRTMVCIPIVFKL